jgi:hypothetical protein
MGRSPTPPDHRDPAALAGLRRRRLERDLPAGSVTAEDIDYLRRRTWASLTRIAIEDGVSLGAIKRAATRDELRLAILLARVAD